MEKWMSRSTFLIRKNVPLPFCSLLTCFEPWKNVSECGMSSVRFQAAPKREGVVPFTPSLGTQHNGNKNKSLPGVSCIGFLTVKARRTPLFNSFLLPAGFEFRSLMWDISELDTWLNKDTDNNKVLICSIHKLRWRNRQKLTSTLGF